MNGLIVLIAVGVLIAAALYVILSKMHRYKVVPLSNCNGTVISTEPIVEYTECLDKCDANSQCNAVQFTRDDNKLTGECQLHSITDAFVLSEGKGAEICAYYDRKVTPVAPVKSALDNSTEKKSVPIINTEVQGKTEHHHHFYSPPPPIHPDLFGHKYADYANPHLIGNPAYNHNPPVYNVVHQSIDLGKSWWI